MDRFLFSDAAARRQEFIERLAVAVLFGIMGALVLVIAAWVSQ